MIAITATPPMAISIIISVAVFIFIEAGNAILPYYILVIWFFYFWCI